MVTVEEVPMLQQHLLVVTMPQPEHNSTGTMPIPAGTDNVTGMQATRVLLSLLAVLTICKYVYRMFFDHLSHIPGPKIAAATHLYEAYYNIVKAGYCKKLLGMHKTYDSPVIRIATNHVHIGDPEYYNAIYNAPVPLAKSPSLYKRLGVDGAIVSLCDPDEHQNYRSIITPLFSRRATDSLGPALAEDLGKVADSMARQCQAGDHTVIQQAYRALLADVACRQILGRSLGLLDTPGVEADYYHPLMRGMDGFINIVWPRIYYAPIDWLLYKMPASIMDWLQPGIDEYVQRLATWMTESIEACESGKPSDKLDALFELLYKSRHKIGGELKPDLVLSDGFNYIIAGMEATQYVITMATWFILDHPNIKQKLEAELLEARAIIEGEGFDHRKIMALPYLGAVVKECLRHSNTVPGMLPRIVPKSGMTIAGVFIPAGTQVSMAHTVIERNEKIFKRADEFSPERWLEPGAQDLLKWQLAFSKGRFACPAVNLSMMELYCIIAVLFGRFDMELYQTTREDMEFRDHFAPILKKPLKIKVIRDRWADDR